MGVTKEILGKFNKAVIASMALGIGVRNIRKSPPDVLLSVVHARFSAKLSINVKSFHKLQGHLSQQKRWMVLKEMAGVLFW